MIDRDHRLLLSRTMERLEEAVRWLRRSETICRKLDLSKELKEEDHDALEAFCSRFARVSDMVIQQAFRSIDRVELEEPGSVLDILTRAEKRRLIETVDQFRLIREVRNEIAHEYVVEDLRELLERVRDYTPILLSTVDRIRAYCEKYTIPREERGE